MTAGLQQQGIALLPWILVLTGAVAVMGAIAVRRHHGVACSIAIAFLTAALLGLWPAAGATPIDVGPLFRIDAYALFFTGIILAATLLTAALAYGYLERLAVRKEEFYLLLLIAALGAAALTAADHLASLFLGLETVSIALYGLIAYRRDGHGAIEAAIKYLVLAGVATGLLAFGIALLYAATGELDFAALGALTAAGTNLGNPTLVAAILLVVVALGFKLSLVPFHLWTPDVYQGAPAPVTGFLATVSKAAALAVLLRYLAGAGAYQQAAAMQTLLWIAIASMLAGNWLALLQSDLKRLLAYSSIAHLGYVLVPLLAGPAFGAEAASAYLAAYSAMTLGAFAVITVLACDRGAREPGDIEEYAGLFWSRPAMAGALALMMLALAGIPLTAGFIAKFYAAAAGVGDRLWLPTLVLVAASAIGLYYYLRVVIVMARPGSAAAPEGPSPRAGLLAVAVLAAIVLSLGVYPAPLTEAAAMAAAALE